MFELLVDSAKEVWHFRDSSNFRDSSIGRWLEGLFLWVFGIIKGFLDLIWIRGFTLRVLDGLHVPYRVLAFITRHKNRMIALWGVWRS